MRQTRGCKLFTSANVKDTFLSIPYLHNLQSEAELRGGGGGGMRFEMSMSIYTADLRVSSAYSADSESRW